MSGERFGGACESSEPIQAETAASAGCIRICIRFFAEGFFDCRFTEGIPVLGKDFSQSCAEGPIAFHGSQAWTARAVRNVRTLEKPVRSFMRIERSSFHCSEFRQMSRNDRCLTLPQVSGNWTQG